jgi:hypothetical protein
MIEFLRDYFSCNVTETDDFFMVALVDVTTLSYSEINDISAYTAFAGIVYGKSGFVIKVLKANLL